MGLSTSRTSRRARPKPRSRAERMPKAELEVALASGAAQAKDVIRARRRLAPEEAPTGANGLLVAEGDSWFDYPFYDVLQELERGFNYRVENVAHKGDTVEEMAYDPGQLSRLAALFERLGNLRQVPRAILLSGGGNDIAGEEFAVLLNHKRSGLTPLNENIVRGLLEGRLRFAVVSLIGAVTELSRKYLGTVVPVLTHGYGYAVPDGRGYLGGFWVLPGPWLEPGFRRKGYADMRERVRIVADLIDRFNQLLESLPGSPGLQHVVHVDARPLLSSDISNNRYRDSWENELHPTKIGFRLVAGEFHRAISKLPRQ